MTIGDNAEPCSDKDLAKWRADADRAGPHGVIGVNADDILRLLSTIAARDAEIENADKSLAKMLTAIGERDDVIVAKDAEIARLTHERDAYRKAKQENDERFMIERDEARAIAEQARVDAEREIARLSAAFEKSLQREGKSDGRALGEQDGRWAAEKRVREQEAEIARLTDDSAHVHGLLGATQVERNAALDRVRELEAALQPYVNDPSEDGDRVRAVLEIK